MTGTGLSFSDVDSSGEPERHLAYLEAVEQQAAHAGVREHTYRGIPLGLGIDVGCGLGRAVADLTKRGHTVVGVDASRAMIESARQRFPRCRFEVGNAYQLPFGNASLDWYRAERTYLHLAEPLTAFAEASRVLAPGGTIVVADQDMDATVISCADASLTRAITAAFTDCLPNGRAGIRAANHLAAAGFLDIKVTALPVASTNLGDKGPTLVEPSVRAAVATGAISLHDAQALWADLKEQDRAGTFVASMTTFVTTARRRD